MPKHSCSSKNAKRYKSESTLGSVEDVKEWEEARCPICMEHPHNAVLLLCSSNKMGCRPYMCRTSNRHSHCLAQFCKSFGSAHSTALLPEVRLSSTASLRSKEEWSLPELTRPCGRQLQSKLVCPLCRGHIYGQVVIEPARHFMNSKQRICSCETCDFRGTYSELRKHARSEHPTVKPTMVEPTRKRNWTRFVSETEFEDAFNLVQPVFGNEEIGDNFLFEEFDGLFEGMTMIRDFLVR